VLGGLYARLAPWLGAPLRAELAARAVGGGPLRPAVAVSELGGDAAVRGAAGQVVQALIAVPRPVPGRVRPADRPSDPPAHGLMRSAVEDASPDAVRGA
jgi:hypothetical protein